MGQYVKNPWRGRGLEEVELFPLAEARDVAHLLQRCPAHVPTPLRNEAALATRLGVGQCARCSRDDPAIRCVKGLMTKSLFGPFENILLIPLLVEMPIGNLLRALPSRDYTIWQIFSRQSVMPSCYGVRECSEWQVRRAAPQHLEGQSKVRIGPVMSMLTWTGQLGHPALPQVWFRPSATFRHAASS